MCKSLCFLLCLTSLVIRSQTAQQKLSREFIETYKNGSDQGLEKFCDTAKWGKLNAYYAKLEMDKAMGSYGFIKEVGDSKVDTQGCKIQVATHVKMERGEFWYYTTLNRNKKVEELRIDTISDQPFYVSNLSVPHIRKELIVKTNSKISLPGTLFLPPGKKQVPVVVIVHDNSPLDRNGTIGKNKIYYEIALGLVKNGVAAFIYDKRTYVYRYGNPFPYDSMTYKEETIDDAVAAVKMLKTNKLIDPKKIFIAGHGQGALCAPMIAEAAKGSLAGIIMMAAPARPLLDLIREQVDYIYGLEKMDNAKRMEFNSIIFQIGNAKNPDLKLDFTSKQLPFGLPAKYWLYDRNVKPIDVAMKLDIPIFVLQGERDYHVTFGDYSMWTEAFKGKSNFSSKLYPKLDHLFFEGEGIAKAEDLRRPNHVSPYFTDDIAKWIFEKSVK